MSSQEEYLDQLLQNLVENDENIETELSKESDLAEINQDEKNRDESFLSELELNEAEPAQMPDAEIDAMLQSVMDEQDYEKSDEELAAEEVEVSEDLMEESEISTDAPAEESMSTVDNTTDLTEEEINRLLEETLKESEQSSEDSESLTDTSEQEDILADLLNESDDEDLKEIQSLLQKSDNNELIQDDSEEVEGKAVDEIPVVEPLNKAEEKKRQREAKKEAKRAAKEARKAEREAQKAKKNKKAGKSLAEKESKNEKDSGSETAESRSAVPDEPLTSGESSLEEEIIRELEAFDFLNDIPEKESSQEVSHSAGEDSLAQIVEQEAAKKSKKGLFARILEFINEEDEDSENEDIRLSNENETIIKEMDKEKKNSKKNKKAKKAGKGNKEASSGDTKGENGNVAVADKDATSDTKKAKKEKKPKKEKQPREVSTESSGKKIPLKQIMMVALVCLSIGGAIVVFVQIVGDYSDKKIGRKAFYEEDYQTCYQNLYGKNLNETEQVMYSKSESILTIRMWLKEYELLAGEGQEAKALDSLLQSVYYYPTIYAYANTWNADTDVAQYYNKMLNILSEKYHLTEEQAKEITNNPDDIEYTRMVMAIVNGDAFGSWNPSDTIEDTEVLQDPLPEEEELMSSDFVEAIMTD